MRIIKRKKGNGEYYYLQHSYRKEGKVFTKEKYLGIEVPRDIMKVRENFNDEFKSALDEKFELIKKNFETEWSRIPESARKKELEEISIAFTYNTNAIEGSTITLEETREIIHDKISPNKSLRDVKETEAHSIVFLKMLDKKEVMSKKLLLEWHKEIFDNTKTDISGKFRDYLVRVGTYLAPDWQEVDKMIDKLILFVKGEKMNPVELSARAHYRFEKIHPFGDGNGRIGRLLMNYILWHSGYPMLIIEKSKRKSYYKSLSDDEERFVKYFIRRYLAVHKKRINELTG